jgi:PIN domain nuclease of toxin-antitoxin system
LKLLLDTHTFLWFINGDKRLSAKARDLIEDKENSRFLSVASLWEMAIKVSLGKLRLDVSFDQLSADHIRGNAIDMMSISVAHMDVLSSLPFHHKDPFDRLIIAKGIVEKTPILGRDDLFDRYEGVQRIW